jgi:hypothetical protein
MIRVILVVVALFVAGEAAAAEQPRTMYYNGHQLVYQNGQWWIVRNQPAQPQQSPSSAVDPEKYKEFGEQVEQITLKMREVAKRGTERDDLRALTFHLREYNQAVAKADWKKADSVAKSMEVSLIRGSAVAADAERRKTARARADAERRHREEMAQRAAILSQLRANADLMQQRLYGR